MANKKNEETLEGGGTQRPHIDDIVDTALEISHAKGWEAEIQSVDDVKHRFATVRVEKYFGGTTGTVSALIEITCDSDIILSIEKSSFHANGLRDLRDAIWKQVEKFPWVVRKETKAPAPVNTAVQLVDGVLRRFHKSVRQLKHRHADRPTLLVQDEYDVQDYLHALLRSLFDDIRSEEYCPSYGGASSRIDFLLKSESIAIEVKYASNKLKDRHVGEQLIVDIQRYQTHPSCKILFCLVYDPGGDIQNPGGLESDLTKRHDNLDVKVIVVSPS